MYKKILLLALIGGCTPVAPQTAHISFNWQHKHAVVTENQHHNGIKLRYLVTLKPHEKGWLLDFGQAEMASTQSHQATQEPMAINTEKPNIIVDKAGMPVEVVDYDAYLNKQFGEAAKAIQNTALMDVMRNEALSEPWCTWLCNWVDVAISSDGQPQSTDFHIADKTIQGSTQYRLLEQQGDWLTVEMRIEHPNLYDEQPSTQQNDMTTTVVTAKIHAQTGEPQWARKRVSVNAQGQEKLQYTVYEFDWQ